MPMTFCDRPLPEDAPQLHPGPHPAGESSGLTGTPLDALSDLFLADSSMKNLSSRLGGR
jgi:hypothetical protein